MSLPVCFHVQSAVCGGKEQSYFTDLEAATGNRRDTAELQQEMTLCTHSKLLRHEFLSRTNVYRLCDCCGRNWLLR